MLVAIISDQFNGLLILDTNFNLIYCNSQINSLLWVQESETNIMSIKFTREGAV